MFKPEKQQQPVLPYLNCSTCPIKAMGYCEGAFSLATYSMEHISLIGCHSVERIKKYLADIFDKAIPLPRSFHQDRIDLSEIAFGIADGRLDLTQCIDVPLFAVSMNVFFRDSGKVSYRNMKHLKDVLKLPSNSKVALIGTSSEKIQQAIWKGAIKLKIFQEIAEFGFDWITSTTFPVWDENPRSDQIINQLRNYLVTDIMANLGMPVIPFIYPYNDCDHKTFGRWMTKRPSITKVAIYAQYYNSDSQFSQLIKNIEKIQRYCDRELQFLIVGVTKLSKLKQAFLHFKNASVISWSPYFEAFLKGKMYNYDLESEQRLDISKPQISFTNYKTFSSTVNKTKNENKTD